MSRTLSLLLALLVAAALAGCDPFTDDAGSGEAAPTGAGTDTALVDDGADGTPGPVQDVWVYERVRTVAGDGSMVDLTGELLEGLSVDESAAVELREGVSFTPAPGLDARIHDARGGVREDLAVVAGVVETGVGRALQVIATPTGEVSVGPDDALVLDLTHLGLEPGAPLVVDFAFAQGIPAAGEDGEDGPALLAERMAEDRFQWLGTMVDGQRVPRLLTVLGSISAASSVDSAAYDDGPGATGVRTASWHGGPVELRTAAGGGGGGAIPAKAKPTMDPLTNVGECKSLSLKCISTYFDEMEKGFEESLDKIFDDNMPPDPEPTPTPTPTPDPDPECFLLCGGIFGDPHLTSFDGHRFDLQLVGEFVAARTDGFEVQTRFTAWGSSTRVSVVSAVAVGVAEHRITVRSGRDPLVRLDGEPVTEDELLAGVEAGDLAARLYGGTLTVEDGTGHRVMLPGVTGSTLGFYVDPGEAGGTEEWTGLLGDGDGEPTDDLTPREGEALALDAPVEQVHDVFGDSWRISDEESLFDYAEGETTATFTDQSFPSEHVTVADLSAGQRAVAEAVCRAGGIQDPVDLASCVLDYALTGEIDFARSARYATAVLNPPRDGWVTEIAAGEGVSGAMRLIGPDGDASHVAVPTRSDAGGVLTALDLVTGEQAWQVDTAGTGCVTATADGSVVTPVPGKDGFLDLGVLDAASGKQRASAPTALRGCDSVAVAGNTVVVRDGDTLLGLDVARPEVAFELELPGMATAAVVSGDGIVWVVEMVDAQVRAVRIDPGEPRPQRIPLPVPSVFGNIAATSDGIVVGHRGEHEGSSGVLRIDASGAVWQTDFPTTIDGTEFEGGPSGPLRVTDQHVVGYAGSDRVVALDLASGDPAALIEPTSFNNNGDRLAAADGMVGVSPFGSENWVEVWDLAAGTPGWHVPVPGEGVHDAKWLGPWTPTGQLVVASNDGAAVVVSKVGPGS